MSTPPAPRRSAPPRLPSDSLAYALLLAGRVVTRVIEGGNLTESLARCWREHGDMSPSQRGAVQDLAYGSLRRFALGDFVLGQLLHKPLADPLLRGILLAALYRLAARPEDSHTTVNQAVAAAASLRNGALRGLANALLRNALRQDSALLAAAAADEAAYWQHPLWWRRRLQADLPDQADSILTANNGHPPMTLRVNRRRCTLATYLDRLTEAGIGARALDAWAIRLDKPVAVERLPGFAEGWVSVQDWGAQRAASLLDVVAGQRVLDACAAPGGKTAHLLETAELDLTALDAAPERLARVQDNLGRLGLTASTRAADCRQLADWWDGQPFARILADVPCSASGVVRRHPDIKWLRRESDIGAFAASQAQILDALWQTLAVDGKMLYVTCSVFREENEAQVAAFADRHGDCQRLPLGDGPALQLMPSEDHDGFFYALLQKR